MTYELMIPPFEYQGYKELKKKQVEEYFQWYIKQTEHRVEVLGKFLKIQGEQIELDYSVESLISVWRWYEKNIIIENKTEEEYKREKEKYPEWMKNEISDRKISMDTYKYGMDVAIYFAEVIIRNSSEKIYWGYFTKPKNRMSVNQPVLLGFNGDMDLNPRLVVVNCTRQSSREKQETRLYEMYKKWMAFIA